MKGPTPQIKEKKNCAGPQTIFWPIKSTPFNNQLAHCLLARAVYGKKVAQMLKEGGWGGKKLGRCKKDKYVACVSNETKAEATLHRKVKYETW